MSLTTDKNNPDLGYGVDNTPVEQNKTYLILSEEDRSKGFLKPYRDSYKHVGNKPKNKLRPLTEEEKERYEKFEYVMFEEYPESKLPVTGRFWTQKQLDERGCGTVTTMTRKIAETYARDPWFYGATYCCNCMKHRPLNEFVWLPDGESLDPSLWSEEEIIRIVKLRKSK
jgi:hypothetical protein